MQLEFLKNKLELYIPDKLKILGQLYEFYIAGGAITSLVTNTDIKDLDIYMKNKLDIVPLISALYKEARLLSVTDKSILYRMDYGQDTRLINLILINTYKTPEEIFNDFDFTCVMGAYDIKSEKFTFDEDFLIDNSMKQLRYNPNTKFPLMSCLRVKKYEIKGYKISKNEMTKILLSVCKLQINSYEDLAKQIGGLYGFNVEELFDTEVEFDMGNVINTFTEITEDFDLISSDRDFDYDVLKRRQDDLIINILKELKEDGKNVTRINFNGISHISVNGEIIMNTNNQGNLMDYKNQLSEDDENVIILYMIFDEIHKNSYYYNGANHIISESQTLLSDTSKDLLLMTRNEIYGNSKCNTIMKLKINKSDMTDNRFATRLETKTAKVVEIFKIKNKIKINKKDIKKKHRVGLIGNLSSLTNTQSIIMQTTKLPF
jgi:hypothetical protein